MFRRVILGALFIVQGSLAACRHAGAGSEVQALVSHEQAAIAFAVVQEIEYLPFAYKQDGCYARALYMSMELAAHSIPSSSYYVYGMLMPESDIMWGYHVAPMVKDPAGKVWLLDPAFQREPLLEADWISKTRPFLDMKTTYYTAGSKYLAGSGDNPGTSSDMVSSFAAMPAFNLDDIVHACSNLSTFLSEEAARNERDKRARLFRRTAELARELKEMGKLKSGSNPWLVGSDSASYKAECRAAVGL